jgi:hypothetical protein
MHAGMHLPSKLSNAGDPCLGLVHTWWRTCTAMRVVVCSQARQEAALMHDKGSAPGALTTAGTQTCGNTGLAPTRMAVWGRSRCSMTLPDIQRLKLTS